MYRNAASAAAGLLALSILATSALAGPAQQIDDAKAKAEANAAAIFEKVVFVKPQDMLKAGRNEADKPVATSRPATGGSYGAIIARHAKAEGVPLALAHAVIRIESNYRPGARGAAGEIGLMQIKHATARGMGYRGSAKALYDPETNIRWGMKYLGAAYRLGGGDTCGAILRYNAGHGAKRMNKVSAAYCQKVKRHMRAA